MVGRRLPDILTGDWFNLAPGDYIKLVNAEGHTKHWFCQPPGSDLTGCLDNHTVTEHEDGTITVSPSILITGQENWHGYLERGVWREV